MMKKPFLLKTVCLTGMLALLAGNINAQDVPVHTFTFNAPKSATVFVGKKTKHYVPFTEKPAVHITETDSSKIWYFNVSQIHNYRISSPDGITQVGTFIPKSGTDTARVFTGNQFLAHSPKAIDHEVKHLANQNVADLFLNINAQGFLRLPLADTTFQIVHCRNWQAIDDDATNYFIDPDFHYTVMNENGMPDNSVVTVSNSGVVKPVGTGTAIVLVTYDAMICHHTTNVGGTPAFFSALWPENTGVFVISVGDTQSSGIQSNMLINSNLNGNATGTLIDAEYDVLYYEASTGGFDYTFKPDGVTSVLLAQPVVGEQILSYSGFSADGVTTGDDGSYTIRLVFGRNIVKLISTSGATEYQIITAKPVTYILSNATNPGEDLHPGEDFSIVFNTLYHPSNKLSGIYNMSAGIQYAQFDTNFSLYANPGQYSFASRAQEYRRTIPVDFTGDEFVLNNGVIKVKGYGDNYGKHRNISLQKGVSSNLNAVVRTGYFGSLPDIHIPLKNSKTGIREIPTDKLQVHINPFTDYIVFESAKDGYVAIYDLSGKTVLTFNVESGHNRIDATALPKGVYILRCGANTIKLVK
jgi:hypothetical protein